MFALRFNALTDLRPAWKPRQKRVPGTGHPLPSSTLRLRARKSRCLYSVYFESIPPCTSPAHLGFYHDIWTACLARSTQSFLLSWQRAVPLFIQLHSKSQFYFLQYLVPLVLLVSNPYPFQVISGSAPHCVSHYVNGDSSVSVSLMNALIV